MDNLKMKNIFTWFETRRDSIEQIVSGIQAIISLVVSFIIRILIVATIIMAYSSYLDRLKEGGGASVRIDFQGPDLKKLDELVASEEQSSRAEVVRDLVRKAKVKKMKK